MKKGLLLASLFAGSLFTMNAQTTISFETSEGYSTGAVSGQQGWMDAYNDSDTSTITVSTLRATNGTQSLQFTSDGGAWEYYDGVIGAVPGNWTGVFDMYFDIYFDSNEDSDYNFETLQEGLDENGEPGLLYVSRLQFNYFGNIRIADFDQLAWVNIGTYESEQWYTFKASYNFNNHTVALYLGDTLLSTVVLPEETTGISDLFISYDNYGSGMTIDNIRFVDPSASVGSEIANSFSVYPNPANDVLNIANTIGAELISVTVTDLNGRTVKQFNSSVEQINISDLNAGVYFVNINSTEGSLTKKIVKK